MSQYKLVYDDGYYITYKPINKEDEYYYYYVSLPDENLNLNSLEEVLLCVKHNEEAAAEINNPSLDTKWVKNLNYLDDIVLYESDDLESIINLKKNELPELFI